MLSPTFSTNFLERKAGENVTTSSKIASFLVSFIQPLVDSSILVFIQRKKYFLVELLKKYIYAKA